MLGAAVVEEEDELLGVVLLLGVVVLCCSVEEVELELELDGVVLVLELLGLVPAAAPWSLGVVPVVELGVVLVLLGLVDDGVWLEVAGGFADWSVLLGVVELLGAVVDWLLLCELDG